MQVQRVLDLAAADGANVPAIAVTPSRAREGAVLVHPTGGCKEQMLGFAHQLADCGVATLAIDLGSDGDNDAAFGARMIAKVEAAIDRLRRYVDVVGCLGAGSGGRVALSSTADYVVAIDPPAPGIIAPRRQHFDTPFEVPSDDLVDPAASVLIQLPRVVQSERPCLLVVPEDELASHFIVRELELLLPRAEARFVSTVSSRFERRLPREWRLVQNESIVHTTCTWCAQAADHIRRGEQVHV